MHSLYILLFALGVYSSVGLIQVGQTSSTSACQIKLHFHNSPVSAFYEQTINGTGCVTNLTTKDNQEVHVINLKKTGLAYRNDIAEVHLFVKSRNDDEVLWEPLIIVLNSIGPVKWRVRTQLLAPASNKHMFVVPSYSSVKIVKGNSRRMVRRVDHLPQRKDKLYEWTRERFGNVTSFSALERGNQLTLMVGPEKSASEKCDLVEGGAKNVDASYEQPQLLSGCMMHPKTTIMDSVPNKIGSMEKVTDPYKYKKKLLPRPVDGERLRCRPYFRYYTSYSYRVLAYVIELGNVDPNPHRKSYVEVELEIKGRNKRMTHRNLLLVLKSPSKVMWKIKTKKLQGYAEIVSNSQIDMNGIKMDPVSERIEEFTETGDKFLKWVEIYVGQVAMYTSISLANKIKLVIPDTEERNKLPPEKPTVLINPFENAKQTKQYLKLNTKTTCHKHGVIKLTMSKAMLNTFKLDLGQISLKSPSCTASIDMTSIVLESAERECGTRKVIREGQTYLVNEIVIHRSVADTVETGSGYHYEDDMDEEEVEGSGAGKLSTITETHMDDEDYRQVDVIKSEFICLLQDEDTIISTPAAKKEDNVQPDIPNVNQRPSSSGHDVTFELQIYKSPLYLEPSYVFPMDIGINDRVYVDASIVGDTSMRVQIISCNIKGNHRPIQSLIHNGCILPGTSWEPVPTGRPFLGSVTQSQRFSFTPNILGEFINQYIYVSCNLTVCRNYLTKKNENIPQCIDNKKEVCRNGLPASDASVPTKADVTKGPLNLVKDSGTKKQPIKPDSAGVKVEPTEKPSDSDKQSVVVDGLESGTVIGIAFAAFFIGVLLMAALWFIHTHTGTSTKVKGPLKHAVATGRAGIDGSAESTPMSTAPITVNT